MTMEKGVIHYVKDARGIWHMMFFEYVLQALRDGVYVCRTRTGAVDVREHV